jgi:dTMP kinase
MSKGKFIVIDGTDGSGKATQTKILVKRLQNMGKKVHMEDFPQYGKKSAGPVEEYLNGLYGTADELGAYIPSMFYAVDRFAASDRIRGYLDKGYIVISNRYVSASMAHQGGKIKNSAQRRKYFKWLFDLEYNFFKIPKPDINLVLHVPAKISAKLILKKGPRFYIGNKRKDIHEKDMNHLMAAEKTFLEISQEFGYPAIECYKDDMLLLPEEISELIWNKIKSRL